jgi:hypothetical protein
MYIYIIEKVYKCSNIKYYILEQFIEYLVSYILFPYLTYIVKKWKILYILKKMKNIIIETK